MKKRTTQPLCIVSFHKESKASSLPRIENLRQKSPKLPKLKSNGEKYIRTVTNEVISRKLNDQVYQRKNGTVAGRQREKSNKELSVRY